MDVFLFGASISSRGHPTSALKNDLTADCITDFYLFLTQTMSPECHFFFCRAAKIIKLVVFLSHDGKPCWIAFQQYRECCFKKKKKRARATAEPSLSKAR